MAKDWFVTPPQSWGLTLIGVLCGIFKNNWAKDKNNWLKDKINWPKDKINLPKDKINWCKNKNNCKTWGSHKSGSVVLYFLYLAPLSNKPPL